ncbi:MAG: DUF3179 domain-containing protein [Candidatus Micrarchaeia archaeon]
MSKLLFLVFASVFFLGCLQSQGVGENPVPTLIKGRMVVEPTAVLTPVPSPTEMMAYEREEEVEMPPVSAPVVTPVPEVEPEVMVTNGVRHIIGLDELLDGGPGKDGIPSIDNPKFVFPSQADWLSDDELVLGLELEGISKAYPLQIMDWHEIVNDVFKTIPVAITYCPLCGSGMAFDRNVNGSVVEFGVSGKLYQSDLVMFDRKTDTYYSQITGQAVVGPLVPLKLKRIPLQTVAWGQWKETHPKTKVLSRQTGFDRPYGVYPYGSYETNSRIIFPVKSRSEVLHPKERVIGVSIGNFFKAFVEKKLPVVLNDELAQTKIVVLRNPSSDEVAVFKRTASDGLGLELAWDGEVLFDRQTKSSWTFEGKAIDGQLQGEELEQLVHENLFWFAWYTFHPTTLVLGVEE